MVALKNCSIGTFMNYAAGKRVFAFGAGEMMRLFCMENERLAFEKILFAFTDNDATVWGTDYIIDKHHIPIIAVSDFVAGYRKDTDIILITPYSAYPAVLGQLDQIPALDGAECFIFAYVNEHYDDGTALELRDKIEVSKEREWQIPRKIHYVWFGGGKIPDGMKMCMESWNRYLVDYEIVRWDESNYDVSKNRYLKSAYEAKKYSKVSNYARLDIIYENGGIYLDTDIEIVRPFDDLLYHQAFAGFSFKHFIELGVGFGGKKHFSLFQRFLEAYGDDSYFDAHQAVYMKKRQALLRSLGFLPDNSFQCVSGLTIYPNEFFSPLNPATGVFRMTENTYSIHHFAGTWDEGVRVRRNSAVEFYDKNKGRMESVSCPMCSSA